MLEHVLESSTIGLTVTAAAERAAVSPRTAYRYFPTLEALVDAFGDWVKARVGELKMTKELAEMPTFVRELYVYYETNTRFFRAGRAVTTAKTAGGQHRSRRKAQQIKDIQAMLAPVTAGGDPVAARRLAATVHCLLMLETYWNLTEVWGLSTAEAAESTITAIEQILSFWRKKK